MSRNFLLCLNNFIRSLEELLLFGQRPSPMLALAGMPAQPINMPTISPEALKDDGILWAVPKHRRTIEKRLNRKFGYPDYNWKPLKAKTNLRTCTQCGHPHEVGILCPHCYDKVRKETQLMQDKIQERLGLDPVEQEVVVLYDGEKNEDSLKSLSGKRIVEMEKPRPMWFTKNLLQKSTQQPSSDTKEVKPTNLG